MIKIIDDPSCRYMVFGLPGVDPSFIFRMTLKKAGRTVSLPDLLHISGIPPDSVRRVKQVHSNRIQVYSRSGGKDESTRPEADGMIIQGPGIYGLLRTADCAPIVIVNPGEKITALVHAGWKGTCSWITRRATETMLRISSAKPEDLLVFAAPCIHACCYEVGEEVIESFRKNGHDVESLVTGGRLDLVQANLRQAAETGITKVFSSGFCTGCHQDLFHSYRKTGTSERMLTLAGFSES